MKKRIEKAEKIEKEIKKEEAVKKTKSLFKTCIKVIIILLILVFASFYYMRFIEPKMLVVKEERIIDNNIPTSFHGFKIVQISDIHYNMTTEKKDLDRIVKSINKLKPDIVIMNGDLVDSETSLTDQDLTDLTSFLDKIDVTMNKYYIKGNHDYYIDVDSIYDNTGFVDLNNNSDLIYINDDVIEIDGFGSSLKNDFVTSSESSDNYRIAVIHEPDAIDDLNDNYNLVFAGHSHNLQINIPYFKTLFRVNGCKNYYDFHYYVNNTNLYITPGIGTSMYKLRLFNPPTINFYRLTNKGTSN